MKMLALYEICIYAPPFGENLKTHLRRNMDTRPSNYFTISISSASANQRHIRSIEFDAVSTRYNTTS